MRTLGGAVGDNECGLAAPAGTAAALRIKLAPHQDREVARMVHVEGLSLRAVAHHYHVGHTTIVRALERTAAFT